MSHCNRHIHAKINRKEFNSLYCGNFEQNVLDSLENCQEYLTILVINCNLSQV